MNQGLRESLPRRPTNPAWLQDYFLATGHAQTTRNATFTVIKRRGHHYAVTCGHVLSALAGPSAVPGAWHPTLALHVGRAVLNLSHFTAEGLSLSTRAPRACRRREWRIDD